MSRTRVLLSAAVLAATLVGALSASVASAGAASKPTIVIGSTNFEEPALGTRAIVVPAIEKGQIDLEPDYAASLLGFLHGGNPQKAGDNIATAIPADQRALSKYGVTVLAASKALDTNVFAVTRATANKYHLTTLSS